jgi:8-oxo-dGTP pyrophosphatase MutT (NUDIX family)
MALDRVVMARGPWDPSDLDVTWRADPFEPDATAIAQADTLLDELRQRGSPSHDGLAAGLKSWAVDGDTLKLELQPARWALRLLSENAVGISSTVVVRDAAGRWLAGRRAAWLATWAGRWALGAAGAVEVDEHPAETMRRELEEEWSVAADRLQLEALVRLPTGSFLLIGQAWLADGATVRPDAEHDAFAWWPEDPSAWPGEADEPLHVMAGILST